MKVWYWFVDRLDEPSTWAGIAAAAGSVSVSLQSNLGLVGAVVAAVVAFAKSESGK